MESKLIRGCALAGLLLLLGPPHARGQVIHLPTFRYFSVQTSVLAPDSGGASLGYVRRSTWGQTARGVPGAGKLPGVGRLLGGRGIGGSSGSGGASVHVTIIDQDERDLAVRAEGAGDDGARSATRRRAEEIAGRIGAGTAVAAEPVALRGLAEIRQANAARHRTEQDQARRYFLQGQQAEANGRTGAARTFYRLAEKRAGSALKREISRRLAALD